MSSQQIDSVLYDRYPFLDTLKDCGILLSKKYCMPLYHYISLFSFNSQVHLHRYLQICPKIKGTIAWRGFLWRPILQYTYSTTKKSSE